MQKVQIEQRRGDIFEDTSSGTVFIHACNCKGLWGKGIASELRTRFPAAFRLQSHYCSQHKPKDLLGKSMLILPTANQNKTEFSSEHYVACIFTKTNPGPAKTLEEADEVLACTRTAMQHLLEGLSKLQEDRKLEQVSEIRMPKVNSGLFNVPWERTFDVLSTLEVANNQANGLIQKIVVYVLD